jgi:hypothetical protein
VTPRDRERGRPRSSLHALRPHADATRVTVKPPYRARELNPDEGFPPAVFKTAASAISPARHWGFYGSASRAAGSATSGFGLPGGRILPEQMFGRRPDATYRRSQSATGLQVQPSAVARGLAMRVLDAGEDPHERKRLGQLLVDELDALAGLPHCDLVVADRAQVHSHNGQRLQSKTYGYYRCTFVEGTVTAARIRIYHRTAVRQQVITTKVFLNTLLHEWEHHHDFAGLRLPRSPHTAGFYARLRALAGALEVAFVMPPEPGADGAAATSAA